MTKISVRPAGRSVAAVRLVTAVVVAVVLLVAAAVPALAFAPATPPPADTPAVPSGSVVVTFTILPPAPPPVSPLRVR